jgi:hypothetical protein
MVFRIKQDRSVQLKQLILVGLFLLQPLATIGQHVDVYYLQNVIIPVGNKFSYVAANEIDSSEPNHLIVPRDSTSTILFVHGPLLSATDTSDSNHPANHLTCLVTTSGYNRITEIRIIDKNGQLVHQQKYDTGKLLTLDISSLKNNFYKMEIASISEAKQPDLEIH